MRSRRMVENGARLCQRGHHEPEKIGLFAKRLERARFLWPSAKCYMNMRPLYQPQVVQTEAVA